jgi:hypothetical protein
MADVHAWVNTVLLAVTTVSSVAAAFFSYRTIREKQLEARQARLRAQVQRVEPKRNPRLCIINDGKAEARNVTITLDGKPISENSEHDRLIVLGPIPTTIGPGSGAGCGLVPALGCKPSYELELTWDDDSGSGRRYRTTLTL